MSTETVACLKTLAGEFVPLRGVRARGRLQGLLFELDVEQSYRNDAASPIEAVYTFPVPASAVLLGFELDIAGRNHKAVAIARKEAERRYEKAVDEGNSAALLTQNDEGLYTTNLANLMPGETATIRYRYAEYLPVHAAVARLRIPTAITPRYGNPAAGRLEGASVPVADLLVDYPFDIEIDFPQIDVRANLRSPTHALALSAAESGLTVGLQGKGSLDRDFVVEIQGVDTVNELRVALDGKEHVAMITAMLPRSDREPTPVALKVLVDCSGSMQGGSILAARHALLEGLEQLDSQDCLSLTVFGSEHRHLTDGMEPADEATLAPLRALVRGIQANMGGTEMASAVQAALEIPVPSRRRADVLLVTDGAIHELQEVLQQVEGSGHRLFVVMIGAAPNEALAKRISERTGGAYAFVSSKDDVMAAIRRMFHHLREAPRSIVRINWPVKPLWVAPLPQAVFSDEPLRLFAGFSAQPVDPVTVEISGGARIDTVLRIPVQSQIVAGDLIPRMAAARRLPELSAAKARDLAVRHQLASAQTSFFVVAERPEGEKAKDLPIVVAVPQMSVAESLVMRSIAPPRSMSSQVMFRMSSNQVSEDNLEIPDFLRPGTRPRAMSSRPRTKKVSLEQFLRNFLDEYTIKGFVAQTFHQLFWTCGEPPDIRDMLDRVMSLLPGYSEETAIQVLISVLTRDVRLSISDPLRERLDFGISSARAYREARRYLQQELRVS